MEEKYNVFDDNKKYEVLLQNGRKKKVENKEELEKFVYNPPNSVPETNGNKTFLSNYLVTFWMPLMGVGGFTTYVQLSKMAYGKKNYSYPSVAYLAMMMDVDVKTVRKYMKILSDLNFVVVVHVTDKRTGKQMSNLYMMATSIPLLGEKELEMLPKRLQEEHEEFIKNSNKRIIFE